MEELETAFEAIRKRVNVLASVRNGNFLFRRRKPEYVVPLDI
ncbi:MAG: hypothetical protein PHR40_05105 [Bacteroidales bacterium]|nr:hypothetical protein [Bacteroidales bacterium]